MPHGLSLGEVLLPLPITWVLNLFLLPSPQGQKGSRGAQGEKGPTGPRGEMVSDRLAAPGLYGSLRGLLSPVSPLPGATREKQP